MPQPLFPNLGGNDLILDWDSTLTTRSTLGLIASIRPDAPALSTFTEAYEADLAQHAAKWKHARGTRYDEAKYAESLKDIELASIKRLEAAGVWKGVTGPPLRTATGMTSSSSTPRGPHDVEKAAEEAVRSSRVELRPGAAELLRTALQRRDNIIIVSVAWSGSWIAACLRVMGISALSAADESASRDATAVIVIANEIDPTGSGRLARGYSDFVGEGISFDGTGDDGVWTALDKQFLAEDFCSPWRKFARTVCVGDSRGDLQMLLEVPDAPSFIVVDNERTSEQRELEDVLQRLQIEVRDVEEVLQAKWHVSHFIRIKADLTPMITLLYGSER